jgi:hypothetical protein
MTRQENAHFVTAKRQLRSNIDPDIMIHTHQLQYDESALQTSPPENSTDATTDITILPEQQQQRQLEITTEQAH